MFWNGCAQMATHFVCLVFGVRITKVTTLTGIRGVFLRVEVFQVISRIVRIARRLDVAPSNHVIHAVAMAVGATHSGGQMDVLVVNPLIPARRLEILRGVTVVAPVGGRLANDVEEHLVV